MGILSAKLCWLGAGWDWSVKDGSGHLDAQSGLRPFPVPPYPPVFVFSWLTPLLSSLLLGLCGGTIPVLRVFVWQGAGAVPMSAELFVHPHAPKGPFPCRHCDRGLGNVLKVKSVHLDSSGDCGGDGGPLAVSVGPISRVLITIHSASLLLHIRWDVAWKLEFYIVVF